MSYNTRSERVARMKEIMTSVNNLKATHSSENPLTTEQESKVNGLLTEFDQLKVAVDMDDRIQGNQDYLNDSTGAQALQHGWRSSSDSEGNMDFDPKAWRELDVQAKGMTFKVRYNVPIVVQKNGYKDAFEEYLRKGFGSTRSFGQKLLQEGVDSSGGYTVPEAYQANMIKKVATMTVFRQFARVMTTSRDALKWIRLIYTTDDQYTSGVRLKWTGEVPSTSTVHRVTEPVFGNLTIPIHTAMASIPLSLDLIEDSAFDLEGIATDLMGEAFGLGEEAVFWTGTGAGQPLGLINNIDTAEGPSSVNSGDASTLTDDGLVDLVYALPAQYENNARIFWAKGTEKVVRKLKNTTTDEYVWPVTERVGAFGQVDRTILGVPISRSEFLPSISGGAFPIVIGQLSGYCVADRVGLSFQRLDQPYAESNAVVILARKRVGGQVIEPFRLKVQKIAS